MPVFDGRDAKGSERVSSGSLLDPQLQVEFEPSAPPTLSPPPLSQPSPPPTEVLYVVRSRSKEDQERLNSMLGSMQQKQRGEAGSKDFRGNAGSSSSRGLVHEEDFRRDKEQRDPMLALEEYRQRHQASPPLPRR